MVRSDSRIASGSALNGKTIAVNVLHGSGQIAVEAWVDKHGGDVKSVQSAGSPFAAMQAALESGRIDAAAIAQPWATSAQATCRSLGPPNDAIAPRFLIGGYVASNAWIAANLDTARRIRAALSQCAHWYNTDPAASTPAVAVLTKQDPAVVAKSIRSIFCEALTPAIVQPLHRRRRPLRHPESPLRGERHHRAAVTVQTQTHASPGGRAAMNPPNRTQDRTVRRELFVRARGDDGARTLASDVASKTSTWPSWPMPAASTSCSRSAAGKATAATPTTRGRRSRRSRGRRGCSRRPNGSPSSAPCMHRYFRRSSPRSRSLPPITSARAASV